MVIDNSNFRKAIRKIARLTTNYFCGQGTLTDHQSLSGMILISINSFEVSDRHALNSRAKLVLQFGPWLTNSLGVKDIEISKVNQIEVSTIVTLFLNSSSKIMSA
jgi:hypothetical protein